MKHRLSGRRFGEVLRCKTLQLVSTQGQGMSLTTLMCINTYVAFNGAKLNIKLKRCNLVKGNTDGHVCT